MSPLQLFYLKNVLNPADKVVCCNHIKQERGTQKYGFKIFINFICKAYRFHFQHQQTFIVS
jgi:hypothetical protein